MGEKPPEFQRRPPRQTLAERIALAWLGRKELPTVKRWLYFWATPIWLVWIGVFIGTALTASVRKTSGWQSATEVLVTARDPFETHTGFAVVLAITTLFIVPVVIGTAVGLIVEAQTRHMRRTQEEVLKDEEMRALMKRVRQLEASKKYP